jgi:hypothetical protein
MDTGGIEFRTTYAPARTPTRRAASGPKAERCRELLAADPSISTAELIEAVPCSKAYAARIRAEALTAPVGA